MKTIRFDPNGGKLKVKYTFTGLIAGSYSHTLWDKTLRIRLQRDKKRELPEYIEYDLLEPAVSNEEDMVELFVEFRGTGTQDFLDYEIKAEIYQENNFIDDDKESKKITGSLQHTTLQIKLLST
jgi:hypothetical protein